MEWDKIFPVIVCANLFRCVLRLLLLVQLWFSGLAGTIQFISLGSAAEGHGDRTWVTQGGRDSVPTKNKTALPIFTGRAAVLRD